MSQSIHCNLDPFCVRVSLASGKPDPEVPWQLGAERPMTEWHVYKGNHCAYYAMNLLRDRIGHQFPPEFQRARKIEKQCSFLRKALGQIIDSQLSSVISAYDLFFEKMGICPDVMYENTIKALIFHELQDSVSEENPFHELSILEKYRVVDSNFRQRHVTMSQISLEERKVLYETYGLSVLFNAYHFKPTTWKPNQSFDVLVDNLRTYGPLIVTGLVDPISLEPYSWQIEKITDEEMICEWSSDPNFDADVKEVNFIEHAVIIVGAERHLPRFVNGKLRERVYFADPKETRDPAWPKKNCTYGISYQVFVNHITRIWNIPCTPQTACEIANHPIETYAFYHSTADYVAFCNNSPFCCTSSGDSSWT